VYWVARAIAHAEEPHPADLAKLTAELGRAAAQGRLTHLPTGFAWDWRSGCDPLDVVVALVARSALDLPAEPTCMEGPAASIRIAMRVVLRGA